MKIITESYRCDNCGQNITSVKDMIKIQGTCIIEIWNLDILNIELENDMSFCNWNCFMNFLTTVND